jgi:CrcB protein
MTVVWVALTGAGGAIARYLLDRVVQRDRDGQWPWGTLAVNVTGCLLLGLIWGWVDHHPDDVLFRTIAGTGFCGAFTTFSTFSVETVRLLEQSRYAAAVRYLAISLLLGGVAAAVGLALTS